MRMKRMFYSITSWEQPHAILLCLLFSVLSFTQVGYANGADTYDSEKHYSSNYTEEMSEADASFSMLSCDPAEATKLISWNLDACKNYDDAYYYNELTPSPSKKGGCTAVSGSIVHRNNPNTNFHSCVLGVGGSGYGMCITANTGSTVSYNDRTVRFSMTINPSQTGKLSKLEFYEMAPEHVTWQSSHFAADYRGPNNRPLKYGVRVKKGGAVIYESSNNNTTTGWTKEVFDFSNDPDFEVTTTTTFDFELVAYNVVGNGAAYNVWDLDNISVFGGCCDSQPNCTVATICNESSYCPVRMLEWLPDGDVDIAILQPNVCMDIDAYDGMKIRLVNPNTNWQNLLFDEHFMVNGCTPQSYDVNPDYCDPPIGCNDISVSLGGDQLVCDGSAATLTATPTSPCVGLSCCEREAWSTGENYCNGGSNDDYVLYLVDPKKGSRRYYAVDVQWTECSDGTARLTGLTRHAATGDEFYIDIYYEGGTTTPPADSPKDNICGEALSQMYYYTHTEGTLVNDDGRTVNVSRRGPAMQLGQGANVTSTGFGASGWLEVDDPTGQFNVGDINVMLSQACTDLGSQMGSYAWSTGETGNVINVSSTGQYCVTYTDCHGCVATDCMNINAASISVDAGADQLVCEGQEAIITPSVTGSSCGECCTRAFTAGEHCNANLGMGSLWLLQDGTWDPFLPSGDGVQMMECGTSAFLTGTYSFNGQIWDIDINFLGGSTTPPDAMSPKFGSCNEGNSTNGWIYYPNFAGTLTNRTTGEYLSLVLILTLTDNKLLDILMEISTLL